MSKSLGNYIGINESPRQIFGKAMSIPDELMQKYFILATDLPGERIEELLGPDAHPRETKAELAKAIVSRYHGEQPARDALDEFNRIFRQKQLPDEMPEVRLAPEDLEGGAIRVIELLVKSGCAKTNGEARRLVRQGGVSLGASAADLTVVDDETARLRPSTGDILKVGKRRFYRILIP